MDVQTALLEYGLNDKEIKIYLGLLEHGSKSAHEISKITGILRQTTYDTLSSLEKKGIVSEVEKNTKAYYNAEKPESFLIQLKEKEKLIKDVMAELNSLNGKTQFETKTKQFNGIKGIKLLYNDFLKSKTTIKTIQPDIPEKFLKEYFIENYLSKRVENKIPTQILKEKIVTEFQKSINTDRKKFREVRLSKELNGAETHIVIYDNKVVFLDYRNEPVAVLIENKSFKDSQETLFDALWKNARIF